MMMCVRGLCPGKLAAVKYVLQGLGARVEASMGGGAYWRSCQQQVCQPDQCGVCHDMPKDNCQEDCWGVWGGPATLDACGYCDGDGSLCLPDCAGVVDGWAYVDECFFFVN